MVTTKLISIEQTIGEIQKYISNRDNINYCRNLIDNHFGIANVPLDKVYDYLKTLVVYTADPDGMELLQSPANLLSAENNYHKKAGAGDCDDFVILAGCTLVAYKVPFRVRICGNNKFEHIYIETKYKLAFDLTHDYLGDKPKYRKYKTVLEYNGR